MPSPYISVTSRDGDFGTALGAFQCKRHTAFGSCWWPKCWAVAWLQGDNTTNSFPSPQGPRAQCWYLHGTAVSRLWLQHAGITGRHGFYAQQWDQAGSANLLPSPSHDAILVQLVVPLNPGASLIQCSSHSASSLGSTLKKTNLTPTPWDPASEFPGARYCCWVMQIQPGKESC